MAGNESPVRSPTAETIVHNVRFVGGTNAVTKVTDTGPGVTCTYISAGIVDLVWSDEPGMYDTAQGLFQATTPADVKLYVLVPGAWSASTKTLRLNMYESGTLTNLAALEWLNVTVTFKKSGTGV